MTNAEQALWDTYVKCKARVDSGVYSMEDFAVVRFADQAMRATKQRNEEMQWSAVDRQAVVCAKQQANELTRRLGVASTERDIAQSKVHTLQHGAIDWRKEAETAVKH